MKFSAALFLASSLLVGCATGQLNPTQFQLDTPGSNEASCGSGTLPACTGFAESDAETIKVTFIHGPGSTTSTNTPGISFNVGACADGAGLATTNDDGLDKTTPSTSGPDSDGLYTTVYDLKIDLGSDDLELDDTDPTAATIMICVTHFFEDGSPSSVVNFQQTELTLTYDLVDDSITTFKFRAIASDAAKDDFQFKINAESTFCSNPSPKKQGEIVCFFVCPDPEDDVGNDFEVTKLESVQATLGTLSQDLIDDNGAVTDVNQVAVFNPTAADIAASSDLADCLKLEFLLPAAFFTNAIDDTTTSIDESTEGLLVEVSGTAIMTDKDVRRLASNSRALQTQGEAEFELDVELARPEGTSGSVTATVTRFALVGAAGAAILI